MLSVYHSWKSLKLHMVLTTNDFSPNPFHRLRYVGNEDDKGQQDIWLENKKQDFGNGLKSQLS